MALSLQDPIVVWQKVGRTVQGADGYKASAQIIMDGLKKYLAQQTAGAPGGPKLQFVPFDDLSDTEVVIADAACKLYALVLLKDTSTATFTKATNSASASSDADSQLRIWQNTAGQVDVLCFPNGKPFSAGITMQGNTTASGGTGSGANGGKGFALIGAA